MNSNLQFEFSNQSSNLGKKTVIFKPQPPPSLKLKKKTNENVENNDQVIIPGLETGTFWVIGRQDNDYYKKILTGQNENIFDYAELKYC